jgi:hypothetical protein
MHQLTGIVPGRKRADELILKGKRKWLVPVPPELHPSRLFNSRWSDFYRLS